MADTPGQLATPPPAVAPASVRDPPAQADASRVWLPEIVQRIACFLTRNDVAVTLRLVCRATAEQFRAPLSATTAGGTSRPNAQSGSAPCSADPHQQHQQHHQQHQRHQKHKVLLTQPVPHHAFAWHFGPTGAGMSALTRDGRRRLLEEVAASGVLPNVELLLNAWPEHCPLRHRVLAAAAGAGQLEVFQLLVARGCPLGGEALDAAVAGAAPGLSVRAAARAAAAAERAAANDHADADSSSSSGVFSICTAAGDRSQEQRRKEAGCAAVVEWLLSLRAARVAEARVEAAAAEAAEAAAKQAGGRQADGPQGQRPKGSTAQEEEAAEEDLCPGYCDGCNPLAAAARGGDVAMMYRLMALLPHKLYLASLLEAAAEGLPLPQLRHLHALLQPKVQQQEQEQELDVREWGEQRPAAGPNVASTHTTASAAAAAKSAAAAAVDAAAAAAVAAILPPELAEAALAAAARAARRSGPLDEWSRERMASFAATSPTPDWREKVLWLTNVCGYPRCSDATARATALPDWRERLAWLTAAPAVARAPGGGDGAAAGAYDDVDGGGGSGGGIGGGGGGFPLEQDAIRDAAMGGRAEALAWILGEGGVSLRPSSSMKLCAFTARAGHTGALKVLLAHGHVMDEIMLSYAARRGHLQTVQWLAEVLESPPHHIYRYRTLEDRAIGHMADAVHSGNLQLLQWLADAGARAAHAAAQERQREALQHGRRLPELEQGQGQGQEEQQGGEVAAAANGGRGTGRVGQQQSGGSGSGSSGNGDGGGGGYSLAGEESIMAAACGSASCGVEVLEWLAARGCPLSAGCWVAAAGGGCSTDKLEWMAAAGCPLPPRAHKAQRGGGGGSGGPWVAGAAAGAGGHSELLVRAAMSSDPVTLRFLVGRLGLGWSRDGRELAAVMDAWPACRTDAATLAAMAELGCVLRPAVLRRSLAARRQWLTQCGETEEGGPVVAWLQQRLQEAAADAAAARGRQWWRRCGGGGGMVMRCVAVAAAAMILVSGLGGVVGRRRRRANVDAQGRHSGGG